MRRIYFILLVFISICANVTCQYLPMMIELQYKVDGSKNILKISFINNTDSVITFNHCFDFQTRGELETSDITIFINDKSNNFWAPIASFYTPRSKNCYFQLNPGLAESTEIDLKHHFKDLVSLEEIQKIKVQVITNLIIGTKLFPKYKINSSVLLITGN